ncbi:hypothetical protein [Paraburkholderia sp. CI3]|uniref:hypothetical protein n=1 Tax=Paraburkholderia sp. CI3 TaxID=2991060 RepID=UPI003D1A047D
MPTLTDGVLYGLGILVLDFLAWRFMDSKSKQGRLALRALMFGLSTYVLFSSGMNPLRAAPWPDEPLRHLLAQVLEVVWWLQGARLVTIVLDRTVLPESWHKERLFQDVFGALVFLAAAVGAIAFALCCNCRCADCSRPPGRWRSCSASRFRARSPTYFPAWC